MGNGERGMRSPFSLRASPVHALVGAASAASSRSRQAIEKLAADAAPTRSFDPHLLLQLHSSRQRAAMPRMPIHRLLVLLLLAIALAACTHAPPRNPMAQWVPSPNFDERRPVIIVLHYTEQDSVEQSLHTLRTRNTGGPVSSHYLVGDDGAIYQLVADAHRAWHAGGGRWGTITDLNSASIGIEIDNDGREPFTEPQVQAVLRLLDDLTTRLRIPRTQVIGHADLAPT